MEFRKRNPNNVLLAKDDVGRAKPTTYRLPPEEFVYGRPDNKREANMADLTSNWMYHNGSKEN